MQDDRIAAGFILTPGNNSRENFLAAPE